MIATYATRSNHGIASGTAFTFHGADKAPKFPYGRAAVLTVESGDVIVTCSETGRKLGIFSPAKKFWASPAAPTLAPASPCRESLSFEFAGEMHVLRCRERGTHRKCRDGHRSWTPAR